MPVERSRTDLPVLLLHNLDPGWDDADRQEALKGAAQIEGALRELGHPVTGAPVDQADLAGPLQRYDPGDYVVLNWCEALPQVPRSEALVARTLERLGFAYTGSRPAVLALSWDKRRVKHLLDRHGVPTPRWRVYRRAPANGWERFPAIVKPAREHCSLGVTPESVVLTPGELHDRVTYVLDSFHEPALVEEFIDGREFHVSLWGNGVVKMLPPVEMDFAAFADVHERLCTYDAKFRPGSRHYEQIRTLVPAPLDDADYLALEQSALAAYRVLGCRDYARLDMRLRAGIPYVLDANPNADISPDASMACAAEVAGYSYGAMLSCLVNLASRRHPCYGARH